MPVLGQEVNLVDILALEAYRVLLPDTFDHLVASVPALTTVGTGVIGLTNPYEGKQAEFKSALQRMQSEAGEYAQAVAALFDQVFPASQQFLSNWSYGPEQAKERRR